MSNLEELYKKLEKYKQGFSDDANIDRFVETVEQVVSYQDPSCFPVLLKYFDDQEEIDFVLENLKGVLGDFDAEIYVKEIMKNIHVMVPQAREWAAGMLYGIFNSKQHNQLLNKYLSLADKKSLKHVLNFMNNDEPEHHRARIDELLNKLESIND